MRAWVWVHSLLLAQEVADNCRADSERAIDVALGSPHDEQALRRVTEAEALAAEAELYEREASEAWWGHVLDVDGLIGMSEELYPMEDTSPLRERTGATPRGTAPARAIPRRGPCWARRVGS